MQDRKFFLSVISDVIEKSLKLETAQLKENATLKRDYGLTDIDLLELFLCLDIRLHTELGEIFVHWFIDDDLEIYNLIDIMERVPEFAAPTPQWKLEAAKWFADIRERRHAIKNKK